MSTVPIEGRMLQRTHAAEFYSYEGLLRNLASERLLYVALLKELLDNALDADPSFVSLSLAKNEDSFEFELENDGALLSSKAISMAFSDFDQFASTKFRILPSRGRLGNALKVVSGAPVALAEKFGRSRPPMLLTITTPEGSCKVMPPQDQLDSNPILKFEDSNKSPRTKIRLSLPYAIGSDHLDPVIHGRHWLLPGFYLFNPWVRFKFRSQDSKVDFSPVSTAKASPVNRPSVHWYNLDDFEREIRDLVNSIPQYGDVKIRDLIGDFRGLTSPELQLDILKSLAIGNISLAELATDRGLVSKLYAKLKSSSKSPNADIFGRLGKETITESLTRIFEAGGHRIGPVYYQCARGVVENNGRQVPYNVEIAVAETGGSDLFQFYGINNSLLLMDYPFDSRGADELFKSVQWEWKPSKGRHGKVETFSEFLKRFHLQYEEGAVVVISVTLPSPTVENYAKSRYDLSPIAPVLVQELYQACRQYDRAKSKKERTLAVQNLIAELQLRQNKFSKFGHIPSQEWTTQQALYYKVRSMMGGNIGMKRKSFINALRRECTRLGNGDPSYREKLGIKAAVRAQFFHRGKEDPVSFDSIESLSEKGSDLLLIEKEGVAEILEPFARKRGIAIMNTRGFAVEYAKQIMKLAEQKRGNIFQLTDLDASGLVMAKSLPQFQRIGIDETMIRNAGRYCSPKRELTRTAIEEDYRPGKHIRSRLLSSAEKLEVAKTRVEIDALLAEVGPEALWKAIEYAILQAEPTRDLRRSLEAQVRLPDYIAFPISKIQDRANEFGKPIMERKLQRLGTWRVSAKSGSLVDVEQLERRIEREVKSELSMERKLRKVGPLLKKAAKLLDEETSKKE